MDHLRFGSLGIFHLSSYLKSRNAIEPVFFSEIQAGVSGYPEKPNLRKVPMLLYALRKTSWARSWASDAFRENPRQIKNTFFWYVINSSKIWDLFSLTAV